MTMYEKIDQRISANNAKKNDEVVKKNIMKTEFLKGEGDFKTHPIGFAKFLLESTEMTHDINGFRGWKYGPTLFDKETAFPRPLDNFYTTHQMYYIFCLTYDIPVSPELITFCIEQS